MEKTVVPRVVQVVLADCNDKVANHLIGCHLSKEALSKKRG